MLGVARLRGIRQVQHRNTIVAHAAGQDAVDLARELRIGWRQVEGLADQPKIDVLHGEQRTRGLLDVLHDALVGKTAAFEPSDAGLLVTVQGIGERCAGERGRRREPA